MVMWNYLLLIAEDVPTAGLHPLVHGGGGVNDEAVEDLEGLLCRGEQGKRSVSSENPPFSLEKGPLPSARIVCKEPSPRENPHLSSGLIKPTPNFYSVSEIKTDSLYLSTYWLHTTTFLFLINI